MFVELFVKRRFDWWQNYQVTRLETLSYYHPCYYTTLGLSEQNLVEAQPLVG